MENSRDAAKCIRDNLLHTHLDSQARLLVADVMSALPRLEGEEAFSIIFMDPPYGSGLELQVLSYLASSSLADEDTLFVVEANLALRAEQITALGYEVVKTKVYKTNQHMFLRPASGQTAKE